MNWSREAARQANHVSEHLFAAHRGALPWRVAGYTVVFGNDGYSPAADGDPGDGSSPMVFAKVREHLAVVGVEELGFGLCDDGYSWAMIVRTGDSHSLDLAVWSCWREVQEGLADAVPSRIDSFHGVQAAIARRVIADGEAG
jgi:hypothetical protein